MIGRFVPGPCAGCGEKIKGEGWDIVHYPWKCRRIEKVRHAFQPDCAAAIDEQYKQALSRPEGEAA